MFEDKDICWTWRNPNPHSRKVHRVSIYRGRLASCVNSLYLYEQALAGHISRGDVADLSCLICRRKYGREARPHVAIQLLAYLNQLAEIEQTPAPLQEFRETLRAESLPKEARQTGLIMADWLEEQGRTPHAQMVRLICCELAEWTLLGEWSAELQAHLERRQELQRQADDRSLQRIIREAPSWLVYPEAR